VTTSEPRPGDSPGVRSDDPGVRATGTGPAGPATSAGTSPGATAPPTRTPPAARAKGGQRHTGRRIGLGLAGALLVFVTVLLVLFVMFNTQTVDISLVFGNVEAPLVLALVIAAVLGGLVVAMAGLAMRARHRDR
jgi:uncharacterized integral membrane protein